MLYFLGKFFVPKKNALEVQQTFSKPIFNVAFDLKQVSSNFCYSFKFIN